MTFNYELTIATLLLLPGLLGVFLPLLPGLPYMLVIAILYGVVSQFTTLAGSELAILAAIVTASLIVDYLSGVLGAKWGGASSQTMIFGVIGLLIGTFLLPPFGGMIGLFAGVLLGELRRRRSNQEALRAATGSLIGTLAGMAINIVLALLFVGLFIFFSLR